MCFASLASSLLKPSSQFYETDIIIIIILIL